VPGGGGGIPDCEGAYDMELYPGCWPLLSLVTFLKPFLSRPLAGSGIFAVKSRAASDGTWIGWPGLPKEPIEARFLGARGVVSSLGEVA
jgi:hypothetical protein